MDLNEQARRAVDEEFSAVDVSGILEISDARSVAALVWLNGYAAGAKATKAAADEAFAKLQATT